MLEEEFEDDALYKTIVKAGLKKELFTKGILSMDKELVYSTVEAGKIIGRPDSTIRNYFRTELIDYIEPERMGKFYRMNYKSTFKLHMILILVEKTSRNIADISYEIGLRALSSSDKHTIRILENNSNNPEVPASQSNLYERLQAMEHNFKVLNSWIHVNHEKELLKDYENRLLHCEKDIEGIQKDKVNLKLEERMIRSDEKYYKMLDQSLRRTQSNIPKNQGILGNILSAFKQERKSEEEIGLVVQEAAATAEQAIEKLKVSQVVEKMALLNEQLAKKEKEREELKEKIEKQKKKLMHVQRQGAQLLEDDLPSLLTFPTIEDQE
ncbi:hypothetical protein ACFOU2_00145 [Bacillus songklensis]|uniref:DNA-binding protein n=1 Tax=Bacillus songklensis TaxID=1069116 RepID=A0ABV8AWQ9_9BACI